MPSRRRQHSRQSLVRPPATPQSNRRWRRTKAIELRAAHEGRYYSIRTRCPDRRPTTEEEHVPWARCVPKLHIPPSAVGNEKSGALSPTSIGLALALRALVAAPIWPPNRALDCSTPRRAISFSVKSAREAAMGAADRVGALSSLMFPAPWLSGYRASLHNLTVPEALENDRPGRCEPMSALGQKRSGERRRPVHACPLRPESGQSSRRLSRSA